jgi:hypothetical protein
MRCYVSSCNSKRTTYPFAEKDGLPELTPKEKVMGKLVGKVATSLRQ